MADPTLDPGEFSALADTPLWEIQRRFFAARGVEAWLGPGGVPRYVTSHPLLARCYARVILAYARDLYASRPRRERRMRRARAPLALSIIELGAGSGEFTYHLLDQLEPMLAASRLPVALRYWITDFADSNRRFWLEHPAFRRFADTGLLRFGLCDAEGSDPWAITASVGPVDAAPADATVVIANYVFDGLRQELVHFDRHRVVDVEIRARRDDTTRGDHDARAARAPFAELAFDFRLRTEASTRPGVVSAAPLIDAYRREHGSGYVLLPTSAFSCIEHFRKATSEVLVLSTDRGSHRAADVVGTDAPVPSIHGSFSLPVNYHALRWLARSMGARTWATCSPREDGLAITALRWGARPARYPSTRSALAEIADHFGPDEYVPLKALAAHAASLTLDQILSLLRLSAYDCRLIPMIKARVIALAPSASRTARRRWAVALRLAWQRHFDIGEPIDIAFDLGVMAASLGACRQALALFHHSLAHRGDDTSTWFNAANAHHELGQFDDAEAALERCLALDPGHDAALELQREIRGRLSDVRQG